MSEEDGSAGGRACSQTCQPELSSGTSMWRKETCFFFLILVLCLFFWGIAFLVESVLFILDFRNCPLSSYKGYLSIWFSFQEMDLDIVVWRRCQLCGFHVDYLSFSLVNLLNIYFLVLCYTYVVPQSLCWRVYCLDSDPLTDMSHYTLS